jgi:hypothetical protein
LVAYRNAQGKLDEQTLFRSDEHRLTLATAGKAWAFDADPAASSWRWRRIASAWRTCSTP